MICDLFLTVSGCSIRILVLAFSLTTLSLSGTAEEPAFDPGRFEVTEIVSGLNRPMELAVAPDGTVFFIELDGHLRFLRPGSRQVGTAGSLTVTTEQENGLIGMALDPNFEQNHWIYFQYSPPDFSGQFISRFTITDDKLDLSSEKILLRYEEQRKECCHHAGSLHFGPRGELFIACGDNTHPHGDSDGYAPIDERPERFPWDAQRSSGNTNSYNGKILRIRPTPDGGSEIPDGNLFPKDGSGGRPEIYVMGCRNPWRMTVDSETGFVYWGEVGPDAGNDSPRGPRGYDEFNQARQAGNFGWPYFIADNQPYADWDFATRMPGEKFKVAAPVNESPNNTGARELPPPQPAMIYYPYAASDKFPELGSGGRSACAGPVFHRSESQNPAVRFPAEYDRCLFIYEWSRHWIKVVHFDDQHNVRSIEPFMSEHRFVRPIDMAFSPEGSLYVMEYGETWGVNPDARIVRIDYVSGNRPPVPVASAKNNIGRTPLQVTLSADGSRDKDTGDKLSYEWRLIRSGATADVAPVVRTVARVPQAEITVEEPGVYTAELLVTDSHGSGRSATVPVLAGNSRPEIEIVKPSSGELFDPGIPVAFEIRVDDQEDGTNDDRKIDEDGSEPIDREAPGRVTLNAMLSAGPPSSAEDGSSDAGAPAGLRRMKASDCFNCHAVNQKRVGPPLLEIAEKYRGKAGAAELSVQRVLKGSTGVWGKIPMIPHSQHSEDEVREMVDWVYSLEPAGLVQVFHGFVGEIPPSQGEGAQAGYLNLEAVYADRGAGEVPPLTASASIYLRPRLFEAESADEVSGPKVLDAASASGGKHLGAIDNGHQLRLRRVPIRQVRRITFRVASAGGGGVIEIHANDAAGPLLGQVQVEVNGSWDQWYDCSADLQIPENFSENDDASHDLVLRFVNADRPGGLMNVDTIRLEK
ncbi:MAG: PQQ-dependent sugar dehydrogenase [Planctomyces sp.]|jgi:cytochrome c